MNFSASLWSGGKALLARAPRLSHPLTGGLLVSMVVAGVVLRVQNVGYPFHFGFDENQYVGAAQQFLIGVTDTGECCHPPLSKLLIGVGMLLLGNNPAGWRFAPLCFGLQAIVLAYLLGKTLFEDRKAGWLAAALMAADGFYLTYSRAALPDMILACTVLWSVLAAVTARGWGGALACAVLVGVAASIKWVGLLVGLPACFALLLLGRVRWYSLSVFAVVPLVHLALWMVGLDLIGQAHDPVSVWNEMQRRQQIHLGFVHGVNPLESHWYTWLVMYHPFVIKSAQIGEKIRLAFPLGNPLLWIVANASLLSMPAIGMAIAARAGLRERWRRYFDARAGKALVILVVCWVSMMLLWFTGRITTYWYHYLTPWSFALILLGGVLSRLDRHFPRAVLVFVLLVLAVSIYFAPVWAELPLTVPAAHRRLIFPLWR